MKRGISRRQFLSGTFEGLGAILVARVGWLFPEGQQVFAKMTRAKPNDATLQPPVGSDLYAGFLLLPEGAPVPAFVQDYRLGIPTMCGVSEPGQRPADHEHMDAVHIDLKDAAELTRLGGFPVYTLSECPDGLRPSGASLIRHGTGEVYGGWVSFEAYDEHYARWYTTVSILARVDFPRPVPLWFINAVEAGGPTIIPEKIYFLPSGPGILVRIPGGFALHWIEKDVYYTLSVSDMPNVDPQSLATVLVSVT